MNLIDRLYIKHFVNKCNTISTDTSMYNKYSKLKSVFAVYAVFSNYRKYPISRIFKKYPISVLNIFNIDKKYHKYFIDKKKRFIYRRHFDAFYTVSFYEMICLNIKFGNTIHLNNLREIKTVDNIQGYTKIIPLSKYTYNRFGIQLIICESYKVGDRIINISPRTRNEAIYIDNKKLFLTVRNSATIVKYNNEYYFKDK